MKATDILRNDHQKIRDILDELKSEPERSEAVLAEIRDSLKAHTECEEQIFYPAMKKVNAEQVRKNLQEHDGIETALNELMESDPESMETYDDFLDNLEEKVLEHVEEEEGTFFPEAEEQIGSRLEELGSQIERFKEELKAKKYPKAA